MKQNNLPFYNFFNKLRKSQEFTLGIDDYFVFIEALKGGFGIDLELEDSLKWDKEIILNLLKTLWLKPNQSPYMFESFFNESLKKEQIESVTKGIDIEQNIDLHTSNKMRDYDSPNLEESNINLDNAKKDKSTKQEHIAIDKYIEQIPEKVRFLISIGNETKTEEKRILNVEKTHQMHRDFVLSDDYFPISTRQIQQAWRRLPLKINEGDSQNIDIQTTIKLFAKNGYLEKFAYQKRRKIINYILLLTDHQGSMIAFDALKETLIETLQVTFTNNNQRESNFSHYYFYNVPEDYLYKNDAHTEFENLTEIAQKYKQKPTAIIILSDAGAARGGNSSGRVRASIRNLFFLQSITPKIVWLNPMPKERWNDTSAKRIAQFVNMYEANEKGILAAVNTILSNNSNMS